ncbi:MAG: right-handed parallel beta-helix repeat-containing protein, partial [Armatimonadota bacterium]|nr:right-handed parallel beta-helix repeat-containing protein [Armatimonadota bacterium]
ENGSANRPDHFTIRNCYFHDSGVRVMIQGFRHGLFENNRFERISGGLALTCDAWWFEGPTCQDIVVRGNVFQNTAFRNAWGTGKAALIIGAGWAEGKTNPALPCAFRGAIVEGNTFLDSSTGAISVSNADHVVVQNNVIRRPFTLAKPAGAIQLNGVADARVWNNRVVDCPGPALSIHGSRRVSVQGNLFPAAARQSAKQQDYP